MFELWIAPERERERDRGRGVVFLLTGKGRENTKQAGTLGLFNEICRHVATYIKWMGFPRGFYTYSFPLSVRIP